MPRLAELGGDWDRRNRLKVYQGTYFVATRQFSKAAALFLDSVATFTCYEMYSYNQFVFYLVVVSLLALDRKTLREKVCTGWRWWIAQHDHECCRRQIVESPEVLTCIRELPHADHLLTSFYGCRYKDFFKALGTWTASLPRGLSVKWLPADRTVTCALSFQWRSTRSSSRTGSSMATPSGTCGRCESRRTPSSWSRTSL